MRLLLTAGFDRALHAVALAEFVTRDGHELAGVVVASPFRLARLREWVRKRGLHALASAARRLLGRTASGSSDQVMLDFLVRHTIPFRSLRAWSRAHAVPYHVVGDLNGERAASIARGARADATLYCGGGILRAKFLDAVGGPVLNAHSGPLPHVRGMNACEWSLLLGHEPRVTIHAIDAGIDTGAVISEQTVGVKAGDTLELLRGRCAELGVVGMRQALEALRAPLPSRTEGPAPSRQCFTLAPVLREALEAELVRRNR